MDVSEDNQAVRWLDPLSTPIAIRVLFAAIFSSLNQLSNFSVLSGKKRNVRVLNGK